MKKAPHMEGLEGFELGFYSLLLLILISAVPPLFHASAQICACAGLLWATKLRRNAGDRGDYSAQGDDEAKDSDRCDL